MVAARFAELGVWTTRGSVERLIKGLPSYQSRCPETVGFPHSIPNILSS